MKSLLALLLLYGPSSVTALPGLSAAERTCRSADDNSSSTGVYRRSGLAPAAVVELEDDTTVSDQLCDTLPRRYRPGGTTPGSPHTCTAPDSHTQTTPA